MTVPGKSVRIWEEILCIEAYYERIEIMAENLYHTGMSASSYFCDYDL